ncbi:transposase [Edwardsiella ictaluri]|uniref:transposase n=1 Tax=Edwardsiella ictaluri TaxID=67780 RepID=UPI0008FFD63C
MPQSLGFGSAMTCWRRLRDWQAQGIWLRFHVALLTQQHQAGHIDWSRASLDGASVASPRGARKQDVTRQTEASWAVNDTSWCNVRASNAPCLSQEPIAMTR